VLVIAVAKGRFLEPSLAVLRSVGVRFSEDVAASRRLIFDSVNRQHRAIIVKPIDVPTYVEYGAVDAGIVGRDVLLESGADVLEPLDLGFARCKLAVAAPKGATSADTDRPIVRVATKYPRIALDYFSRRGIPVEIIPLSGSIELGPLVGLADRIVDLVETGQTLLENGLEIVDVIAESSARLIVNRANYQTKRHEIVGFMDALEETIRANTRKGAS
jgi:ATP phosphoribosyltransferase